MSILLQIKDLKKTFGSHIILNRANLTVSAKQKIAVIGRNGAGKSTLFKIIIGEQTADSGSVLTFDRTNLGYIQQEDDFLPTDTVFSYLQRKSQKEIWECAKIASQFELKNELLESKIHDLSGGYQMRVKLALMLLFQPNLLLLDEPTNYLDLSTMLLLEDFLINYKGAYLIISHDRRFIKNTCSEIIDIEHGKAYHYPGGLENYLAFKQEKLLSNEKFNKKQEAKKKHLQKFIDRFGAKASKAAQAKSKAKQIMRIKSIDIENTLSTVMIKIPKATDKKGLGFRIEDLAIGYLQKQVAKNITIDIEKGNHIAVLGDNGQGKSTFLKTLAKELPVISGNIETAKNLRIAYYAQHVTNLLNPQETVEAFLNRSASIEQGSEDVYRMAGDFLFSGDDIKKPISVLSGGEKARLCLASILLKDNDVLLLDEPTNHLDFETAEALALALAESNATVLFISHDRTFTNIVADNILEVKDSGIKPFRGDYDDYIYYLRSSFSQKRFEEAENVSDKKIAKREAYEKDKADKKAIIRLENKLNKANAEKADIIQQYEKDPLNTDPELKKRLIEVNETIEKLEEEWFALNV